MHNYICESTVPDIFLSTPDETTQLDIPDTPAPVFAARAIKRAVFGTPAPPQEDDTTKVDIAISARDDNDTDTKMDRSPAKPPGILLTPGTGTSRRKTVTFRHDVKANNSAENITTSFGGKPRPRRTKLTEAFERSLKQRPKREEPQAPTVEDEWVEEEDEQCEDNFSCEQDQTIDLNDPRSGSGKYWKASFEKYHGEAKIEMEKLVKYKQLAKSYAKMKDAEAIELRLKLQEEQEKVSQMEKNIAEQAANLASKMVKGEKESPDIMKGLAKQTALAVKYRKRIEELESLLKEKGGSDEESQSEKKSNHTTNSQTQKTLLETKRELRRARAQTRELNDIKERLERAETRAKRLDDDNRRLREESANIRDLERKIKRLEADVERKQGQYENLQRDYDTLKENAKARHGEATWVVQQKDEKISELKKEVRSLKSHSRDSGQLNKQLDAALMTENLQIIAALKKEVDLLGGNRRRNLGKKMDTLVTNMKSLGYEPDVWQPTEIKELNVAERPVEQNTAEPVQLLQEPTITNTFEIDMFSQSEKREKCTRSVKLANTGNGARVVGSSTQLKPMIETSGRALPGTSGASINILGDSINKDKLDILNERRERRWREFGSKEEKPTIASLATGVAELEAAPATLTLDNDDDWHRKYDDVVVPSMPTAKASVTVTATHTPLRSRKKASSIAVGRNNAASTVTSVMVNEKGPNETPKADLVTDQFARLGMATPGGDETNKNQNGSVLWTGASKTSLPPDRLSAALARIEQRKLERKRAVGGGRSVLDKENVRP